MEWLEIRCVPAAFIVTTGSDSGVMDPAFGDPTMGDLRYCINQAIQAGGGTIQLGFAPGNYGPNNVWSNGLYGATTVLESQLPSLTKNITLTAYSPPGGMQQYWAVTPDSSAVTNGSFPIFSVAASCEFDWVNIYGRGVQQNNMNGGGITNNGTLYLYGCTVSSCSSINGGGIYNAAGATLTLDESNVWGNTASGNGGGIYNTSYSGVGGRVTCYNSIISYNKTTDGNGGGIYNGGGRIDLEDSSWVRYNTSGNNGGGIYNTGSSSSVTMSGGQLSYNTSSGNGGGLYSNAGSVTFSNVQITNNSAGQFSGGGFYLLGGTLTLDTCTISGNTASTGPGGAWATGASSYTATDCTINDAIVSF